MSDTDQFSDLEILAKTIWGESRSESDLGQRAIACVVLNRVNSGIGWWGRNVRDCCLKPFQFSCWNPHDTNYPKLLSVTVSDAIYAKDVIIAGNALAGALEDVTNGATSYYAKSIKTPSWAIGKIPCADIGAHLFFKLL